MAARQHLPYCTPFPDINNELVQPLVALLAMQCYTVILLYLIQTIIVAINSSMSNNGTRPLLQPHGNSLSAFGAINTKTLHAIVKDLNLSTCCFDTVTTIFFKNVFSCLEMDVLKFVSGSLLTNH